MSQTHEISSYSDLKLLRKFPEDRFIVTEDITPMNKPIEFAKLKLKELYLYKPMYEPPTEFTGTLDGKGHKISRLSISGSGLVGTNRGEIKNLELGCSIRNIKNKKKVGCIASKNDNKISNCTTKIEENQGDWIGGIAGENKGTITGCESTIKINNSKVVGGIVGFNFGDIKSSSSIGLIKNSYRVGGITGKNFGTTSSVSGIRDCESECKIINCRRVGGIAGINDSEIISCQFKGEIEKSKLVGAIAGVNQKTGGKIKMSYVDSDNISIDSRSIISGINEGRIENSFWTRLPNENPTQLGVTHNVEEVEDMESLQMRLAAIKL